MNKRAKINQYFVVIFCFLLKIMGFIQAEDVMPPVPHPSSVYIRPRPGQIIQKQPVQIPAVAIQPQIPKIVVPQPEPGDAGLVVPHPSTVYIRPRPGQPIRQVPAIAPQPVGVPHQLAIKPLKIPIPQQISPGGQPPVAISGQVQAKTMGGHPTSEELKRQYPYFKPKIETPPPVSSIWTRSFLPGEKRIESAVMKTA